MPEVALQVIKRMPASAAPCRTLPYAAVAHAADTFDYTIRRIALRGPQRI